MELNDFRRQWKQPAAGMSAGSLDAGQVRRLLKAPPGLVEKMRRNVQRELALAVIITVGILVYVALTERPAYRLLGGLMLLSAGITLFYHYQKLELLKRMARNDDSIHGHLDTLYKGLRKLLRFYKRITLAAGPVTMLLMASYHVGQEVGRTGPFRWKSIGIYMVLMLIFSALMYVAAVYSTHRYQQRLYGQYLDRLEASLRELEEQP